MMQIPAPAAPAAADPNVAFLPMVMVASSWLANQGFMNQDQIQAMNSRFAAEIGQLAAMAAPVAPAAAPAVAFPPAAPPPQAAEPSAPGAGEEGGGGDEEEGGNDDDPSTWTRAREKRRGRQQTEI